jgi:hypothetical protein
MEQDEAEVNAEDTVTRESGDELSDDELSDVTGGDSISFNYGHIEHTNN